MRFVPASDVSLLVDVSDEGSGTIESSDRVLGLFRALSKAKPAWLLDLHPAYASLLVEFVGVSHRDVEDAVRALVIVDESDARRTVVVPVRYDGDDLAFVAAHTALSVDDVIACHTAPEYRVAFLGFMPGFAYLLGLDERLTVPRLSQPRVNVAAGAVAIGGAQTAVYPSSSPGGWRIIGHTGMAFDATWVSPGDIVRFVAVS